MNAFLMMKRNPVPLLLLLAVALSLYTHSMVWKEFTMPTYGNTFIHVASIRHMLEHASYPVIDYSYGGGIPNLYVPFYRLFIANSVLLTGLSIDFISRLAVMLFAILVPLGFFAVTKRLFGLNAGIAAAFLASFPGELLIYTVRPLPQSLGMVLLPVAFLAIFSEKWRPALLITFGIAMVHQEAIAFLVGAVGVYAAVAFLFYLIGEAKNIRVGTARMMTSSALSELKIARLAVVVAILGLASYVLWHYFVMNSFNIFDIAQFKYHEGGLVTVDSFLTKTGIIVTVFSLLGLTFVGYRLLELVASQSHRFRSLSNEVQFGLRNSALFLVVALATYFHFNNYSMASVSLQSLGSAIVLGLMIVIFVAFISHTPTFMQLPNSSFLFTFAVFGAGVAAVKNDVVGIRVFMDRFLVHLQEPLIILAALGVAAVYEFFEAIRERP
ncbi:glycosyltransferase family 39 protein [Candidatus Micrarchaeota archaeon]|nr:glycosyltransferase family 39 protein [Candidatus Micrarchaeota archaeon]